MSRFTFQSGVRALFATLVERSIPMKRPTFFVVALVTLLTLTGSSPRVTTGQELPPGPTTVYRSTFEVANQPALFDTIQMVLDFAPGAWTPPHSHGGETLILVQEGQMTLRQGDTETTYGPGESWREMPGAIHAAGNTTTERARVFVTFLLPKGAQLTTLAAAAPAPAELSLEDRSRAERTAE
jgi:quercetin dioxygenase-like cupin family protein